MKKLNLFLIFVIFKLKSIISQDQEQINEKTISIEELKEKSEITYQSLKKTLLEKLNEKYKDLNKEIEKINCETEVSNCLKNVEDDECLNNQHKKIEINNYFSFENKNQDLTEEQCENLSKSFDEMSKSIDKELQQTKQTIDNLKDQIKETKQLIKTEKNYNEEEENENKDEKENNTTNNAHQGMIFLEKREKSAKERAEEFFADTAKGFSSFSNTIKIRDKKRKNEFENEQIIVPPIDVKTLLVQIKQRKKELNGKEQMKYLQKQTKLMIDNFNNLKESKKLLKDKYQNKKAKCEQLKINNNSENLFMNQKDEEYFDQYKNEQLGVVNDFQAQMCIVQQKKIEICQKYHELCLKQKEKFLKEKDEMEDLFLYLEPYVNNDINN